MDIVLTKILVAILFGTIRFVFGILPVKLQEWLKIQTPYGETVIHPERRQLIDCGITQMQSFGGGVLFATSFLYMMPQVYYSVEELRSYGVLGKNYPYSQMVVSMGFFSVYFAEEISHWVVSRASREPKRNFTGKEHRVNPDSATIPNGMAFEIEKENDEKTPGNYNIIALEAEQEKNKNNLEKNDIRATLEIENNFENFSIEMRDDQVQTTASQEEKEEKVEEEAKSQQQSLRCVLVVLALSFHATFEGLSVGLQHSSSNIWYLFTAVSIHSATILFCIGLELIIMEICPRTLVRHMLFLAATSPVGVTLGLIISLTTNMHTKTWCCSVVLLEGLSTGIILYITFFEVLSREKERRVFRIRRAICIGAGFAMMAALETLRVRDNFGKGDGHLEAEYTINTEE